MDQLQKADYRQLCKLQTENYELKQELDDLITKYQNLKKQQQIWDQINRHNMTSQQLPSGDDEQLSLMKQQFVAIVRQKQQQEHCIRELRQKVEDMKYTMQEMRQLGDKQERIHLRQVELFEMQKQKYQQMLQDMIGDNTGMGGLGSTNIRERQNMCMNGVNVGRIKSAMKETERKLAEASQRVQWLQEQLAIEKETNAKSQQKLEKCSQIARQMEEYYTNELEAKQRIIIQLQTQLAKHYQQSRCQLPSPHTKLASIQNEDCSSLKCSSIVSEYHHQLFGGQGDVQFFDDSRRDKDRRRDKSNDKYADLIEEIQLSHAREINTCHQKINFLTQKLQALQAEKSYHLKNNNFSNLSHSQASILPEHLQSIQSLNQNNTHTSKSFKNPILQQSVNLKLSKASANDSFTQFTPKSEISQSVVRQTSQNNKCENSSSGLRPKLTAIKTPSKTVQKSLNLAGNRNSCSYQRVVLGQSNSSGY